MTSADPAEVVRGAVANAALDGRAVEPEWQAVLLRVASGELTGGDAARMARQRDDYSPQQRRLAVSDARWVAQEAHARDSAAKDRVIADAVRCAGQLPAPLGQAVIDLFAAVKPFTAADGYLSASLVGEHSPEMLGLAQAVVQMVDPG